MISLRRKTPKPHPKPRAQWLEFDDNGEAWFVERANGLETRTRLIPADEEDQ